jgi:hypothetical protein
MKNNMYFSRRKKSNYQRERQKDKQWTQQRKPNGQSRMDIPKTRDNIGQTMHNTTHRKLKPWTTWTQPFFFFTTSWNTSANTALNTSLNT